MSQSSLTVEDRFELLDLFARYNHLFEAGDGDAWARCFTPDGEFSGPAGTARGFGELANLCEETTKRFPVALHFTDHHLYEPAGSVVHHKCILSVQYPHEKGVQILLLRYSDELVRHDGSWCFRRRTVEQA